MSTGQDRVLMVDMMSGANDYGLELCTALARRCDLTVVTVTNTSIAILLDSGVNHLTLRLNIGDAPVGGVAPHSWSLA